MNEDQESVPIITANYQPLRFILRKGDKWAPTLRQLNARTYNYVKLHRLSTYVDVGIAPFSMGVCFDGTLLLPALPQFKDTNVALELFNRTLTELLFGGIYCEAVTPEDLGYGSLSFDGYARISGGGKGSSVTFHRAIRTKHVGTIDVIRLLKPDTLKTDKLQASLVEGRKHLTKVGDIPREQLLYGATFHVRQQWAEALIHTWTTTERLVENAWQKHVISPGEEERTRKERDFLNDHRSWPVSTKLEVLFQKDLLPHTTLSILDEVRKARNEFAHRGVIPSQGISEKALMGCFQMASLCASDFAQTNTFEQVAAVIIKRCDPRLFPKKAVLAENEVSHWLAIPPLPGDKSWGKRRFEVIEELRLKPMPQPAGAKI